MAIGFKGSDQEKQLREIQKKFKELYNQKSGAKATEGASHSLANNGKGDYNNYKTHNLFTRVIRKFHDTKRNEFFVNDFENYYKVRTEEYGSYEVHDVIKISGNEERIMQHEKELSNETNTNGKSTNRNNEVFRYIEGHNHWNNAETTGQSWTEFIDEVLKKYESEGTDGYGSYEQGLGNSRGNRYSLSDKTSSTVSFLMRKKME